MSFNINATKLYNMYKNSIIKSRKISAYKSDNSVDI